MNQKSAKKIVGNTVTYLALTIWALTTAYPLLWVILNSFKDKREIMSQSFSLPVGDLFTLDNYRLAFEKMDILGAYINSLSVSGMVSLIVIILAGLASYALVRYEFPGRKMLQGLILAGMMFPAFSTIIPVFRMESAWGIVNTDSRFLSLLALSLPYQLCLVRQGSSKRSYPFLLYSAL